MGLTTEELPSISANIAGKLESAWRKVRLSDVAVLNPRRPMLDRSDDAPTTFVPMAAVDERLGIIVAPQTKPYGDIKRGYTYFAEGDVLFAKITPCMENGKHVIAKNLIDGIGFGTTEFHVIRPGPGIMAEWLHFFLRQPAVLQAATAHFTGAVGQQRVPQSFLEHLEIPVPSLGEQERIVALLRRQMARVERARTVMEETAVELTRLQIALLRAAFRSDL